MVRQGWTCGEVGVSVETAALEARADIFGFVAPRRRHIPVVACSMLLGRDGTTGDSELGMEDPSDPSLNPCFAARSATLDACDRNILLERGFGFLCFV
jgi:hypothetical protein